MVVQQRAAVPAAPAVPWPLLLVLTRWRAQWRLQAALLLVAVTAAAALCALVPLVQATTPAVVVAAITRLPAQRTAVDVQVIRPGDTAAVLRRDLGRSLAGLLRTGGPPASTAIALAQPLRTTAVRGGALVYAAAVDEPAGVATLLSGAWPRPGTHGAAVPEAAAQALGLRVGDRIPLTDDTDEVPALVVSGVYRPRLDAAFWQLDPLRSRGQDPQFADPASDFAIPGQAFGPLLASRGAFDDEDLPLLVVDLRFQPDLRAVHADDLRATAARLADADTAAVEAVGAASLGVGVTSDAPRALRGIDDGLGATRALVGVAGTLLGALTVAVLLIAARLLGGARAGEQRVLVERGAGRRHVVGLVAAEAAGTGLVVAAVAPAPALLLYALLVDTTGARAAQVPRWVGASPAMWAVSAAFGLLLATVLTGAALRPPAADRAGRASRVGAAARSGADVAVLVVALVLLQRLLATARPPSGAALAAPVVLLVAAALVGLRLVALAGRALEPIAARTPSAVAAIAAFELARRAQRSTAAVLVVALGLGCAAFGLAQQRTWERSQEDQAVFAVGAPVRAAAAVPASRVRAADPRAALGLFSGALLTGDPGSGGSSAAVRLLALPPRARDLLAGAQADGASAAVRRIETAQPTDSAPAVPARADALRIVVPAASRALHRPAGATVTALLSTVDGIVTSSTAQLPTRAAAVRLTLPAARPLHLAGLRFTLPPDGSTREGTIRIDAVVPLGGGGGALARADGWHATANSGRADLTRWKQGFAEVTTPALDNGTATVQLLAWPQATSVPVVLDRAASRAVAQTTGGAELVTAGGILPVSVAGVVTRVPGAAPVGEVASGAATTRSSVVVADREQLQRVLIEQSAAVGLDGEWWLAPAASDASTVTALGRGAAAIGRQQLTARLREGPLRVPVRPALLLLVATAGLLTLVAFAVQVAAARHDRRFDLAQLRAAGATRGELARLDALVAAVLIGLGALVGLPAGAAIAAWAGPRLVTGPDGGAAVPPVVFDPALPDLAVLVLAAAAVLLAVVQLTALAADRGATARLIRTGGEP